LITIQDVSGSLTRTGEIAEANPADEPTFSGCYVFKDIDAGKVISASMSTPPAGCIPAVANPPTITIEGGERRLIDITINCQPSDVGYLKIKVVGNNGLILTRNSTITVWTQSGSFIPGTGIANSLSMGAGSYTEEVTVPANQSLYAWVRGLPLGYIDHQSETTRVSKGQHKAFDIYLNKTAAPRVSVNFTFSGASAPRIVSKGSSFTATVSEIRYGNRTLTSASATVTGSINGLPCIVTYSNKWTFNCQAPNTTGSYTLVFKAIYNGSTGSYTLPIDVREYRPGTGLLTITPVFTTYGTPPLDLYYDIQLTARRLPI